MPWGGQNLHLLMWEWLTFPGKDRRGGMELGRSMAQPCALLG